MFAPDVKTSSKEYLPQKPSWIWFMLKLSASQYPREINLCDENGNFSAPWTPTLTPVTFEKASIVKSLLLPHICSIN